jgi:hypothetical protein
MSPLKRFGMPFTSTIVEYSAEEEIILKDGKYTPRSWPVSRCAGGATEACLWGR